jgi:Xaa-Pro dipeptidase
MDPAPLYRAHLDTLLSRVATALERGGFDHLLIASGVTKYEYLDDRAVTFRPNPQFVQFLPLTQHTDCWIAITPGRKPVLVYYQPDDYWHLPPAAPDGAWVEHFDIRVIRSPKDAAQHLPPAARCAILAEGDAALDGYAPNNPAAVVDYLHYYRACKTPYELALMRQASARAVRGHRAAEAAFRHGESELGIHRAYLAATGHHDTDLPYGNIVALNEHGAVLHYQHQQASRPHASRAFLIDAGATADGYASDITRTYANGDADFAALVHAVDQVQLQLVDHVRAGRDYAALHVDAHRLLGGVLQDLDIVRMAPEAQVANGITSVFFPHGLGHLLGIQVHDIGGFMATDAGGRIERPAGHPFLRLTRTLSPGMVVTIEPGIYFIDSLLAGLRDGAHASAVNWTAIDHLKQFGGVRIEDDVACTESAPHNLTREAFGAALA